SCSCSFARWYTPPIATPISEPSGSRLPRPAAAAVTIVAATMTQDRQRGQGAAVSSARFTPSRRAPGADPWFPEVSLAPPALDGAARRRPAHAYPGADFDRWRRDARRDPDRLPRRRGPSPDPLRVVVLHRPPPRGGRRDLRLRADVLPGVPPGR